MLLRDQVYKNKDVNVWMSVEKFETMTVYTFYILLEQDKKKYSSN